MQRDLNRWLPLVKWLLAIPHYVALIVLWAMAIVAVVVAWFAISPPDAIRGPSSTFVVGVGRSSLRVDAYAFLLVTDRYAPFSLK